MGANEARGGIVGRAAEAAAMASLFADDGRPSGAVVLTGGPGIGKTTLWEAGVERARAGGARVLEARPSGAEAALSFAVLTHLLDEVSDADLAELPAPQRRALHVALPREDPGEPPPEPHAIAVGLRNGLRLLGAEQPLLIAIDDLQWIDPPSADALVFAARRL